MNYITTDSLTYYHSHVAFLSGFITAVPFIVRTRAVTIHQTHDSVRITIFDPRFGSYHDFFVGGGRKKKEIFLKQYFLLNNI